MRDLIGRTLDDYRLVGSIGDMELNGEKLEQRFISQPDNPYSYSIKWDGEWQITYETFRDMGIAYAVGLVLIFLLWTTMTCDGATPPATGFSVKRPRFSLVTHCRRWPSTCWPASFPLTGPAVLRSFA